MQVLSSNYAKTQFGQMIDMAQKEPVRIKRHNRVVAVIALAQDYADMRSFYPDRAKQTLQAQAGTELERRLTQDKPHQSLRDEG